MITINDFKALKVNSSSPAPEKGIVLYLLCCGHSVHKYNSNTRIPFRFISYVHSLRRAGVCLMPKLVPNPISPKYPKVKQFTIIPDPTNLHRSYQLLVEWGYHPPKPANDSVFHLHKTG